MATVDERGHPAEEVDTGAMDAQEEDPNESRLMSLPADILRKLARRMGPRARTASRALLDAYGRLDCGLRLEGEAAAAQLMHLLRSGGAAHLRHITTLELEATYLPVACADWSALAALICCALPSLAALKLPFHYPEGASLAMLPPLAPTLTSLDTWLASRQALTDQAALRSLRQLTGLQSLTLRGNGTGWHEPWLVLQQALGGMPRLAHLSFGSKWSPRLLADLATRVPQLTCLSLGVLDRTAAAWDDRTTAAVRRGLPLLRTLSAGACRWDGQEAAALEAMVGGLAQCTGVEAVHLSLGGTPPPVAFMEGLARLPLASLRSSADAALVEPVLGALRGLSGLTRLDLTCESSAARGGPRHAACRSWSCLPSSLADLRVLGHWDPLALLCSVQRLPCLRTLHLHMHAGTSSATPAQWGPEASEQLSKVTRLTTLSIAVPAAHPPGGLLLALSALTSLTELRLSVQPQAGGGCSGDEGKVKNEDLLHLLALRERLTCLHLTGLHCVSWQGVAVLLDGLTNLQQLEMWGLRGLFVLRGGGEAEALLPTLSRISSLRLAHMGMPSAVRDALAAAAKERGCALEVMEW